MYCEVIYVYTDRCKEVQLFNVCANQKMTRVEATKFLVSTVNFLIGATKFLVSTTKFDTDQKF